MSVFLYLLTAGLVGWTLKSSVDKVCDLTHKVNGGFNKYIEREERTK